MKKVNGFLAQDGTFFDDAKAAELYEAQKELAELLEEDGKDPDKYMELLERFYVQTIRYIEAKKAVVRVPGSREGAGTRSQSSTVEAYTPNVNGGEVIAETVQQQPGGERKHVSDVGRRQRTKKVSDGSKESGT